MLQVRGFEVEEAVYVVEPDAETLQIWDFFLSDRG